MTRVLVIHGPNLNLLGTRERDIYGLATLADIDAAIARRAADRGAAADAVQETGEGAIIDHIHRAVGRYDAIVINPAAYAHTSVAIRDALAAVDVPAVEVHLSNIHARESFRQVCVTAGACAGLVCGLGVHSYLLGLDAALALARGDDPIATARAALAPPSE